ncbi:hypothetical protein [Nocardia sp. Marseille-Q1738]
MFNTDTVAPTSGDQEPQSKETPVGRLCIRCGKGLRTVAPLSALGPDTGVPLPAVVSAIGIGLILLGNWLNKRKG